MTTNDPWLLNAATDKPNHAELIACMTDCPYKASLPRLDAAALWAPSSKIGEALCALVESAPWRASSSKPFWFGLFGLLAVHATPAHGARIEASAEDTSLKINGLSMRRWVKAQLLEVAATLKAHSIYSADPTHAISVREALGLEEPEARREALTELWRRSRARELASALVADQPEVKKPPKRHDAWLDLAASGPEVIDALLVHAGPGRLKDACERLNVLATFAPDPRIGNLLARYVLAPPAKLESLFGVALIRALAVHADEATLDQLEEGGRGRFGAYAETVSRAALAQATPLSAEARSALITVIGEPEAASPTQEGSPHLAQLRDLLAEAPSDAGWRRVVELFDAWHPGPELEVGVEYAQAHLEGWPDELRVAPAPWLGDSSSSRSKWTGWGAHSHHPALRLVRKLAAREQGTIEYAKDVPIRDLSFHRRDKGSPTLTQTLPFQLTRLSLSGSHPDLEDLLADARLEGLETLCTCFGDLEDAGSLLSTLEHGNLKHLDVSTNGRFSGAVVAKLAESPVAAQLESLSMPYVEREHRLLGEALSSFPKLKSLKLSSSNLTEVFEHLESPTLEALDVNLGLNSSAARALSETGLTLRKIAYGQNEVDAEAFRALCASSVFEGLEHFSAWRTEMGKAHLEAMRSVLPQLITLELNREGLGEEGFEALVDMPKVERLELHSTDFGNKSAKRLAGFDLPSLRRLDLSHNDLTSTGMKALCKAAWMANLSYFNIWRNRVTAPGGKALLEVPFKRLDHLIVANNRLGPEVMLPMIDDPRFARMRSTDIFPRGDPSTRGLYASATALKPGQQSQLRAYFGGGSYL